MKIQPTFLVAIMLIVGLGTSTKISAQEKPIRHVYAYDASNDRDLVKAKTDLFLLNVLASEKFKMTTNSAGDDHLDVNLMAPYDKGEISTRVRYDFLKEGYVVSLSSTEIHGKDKSLIRVNDPKNELHQKLLDQFERLFFTTYEKEIKKS
ncbi:hypothetical protein [Chryseobacterium sp. A321]